MKKISRWSLLVSLALIFPSHLKAQLISVDINGSVRSDVTAPGFLPWYMASGLGATFTNYSYTYDPDTGLITSTNITAVGCQLTQISPSASSTMYLDGEYVNKDGNETSSDPSAGWRLSMDGCRVRWKDDGATPKIDQAYIDNASFNLTISNLSAGVHTITTYHNDVYPKPGNTPAWHGTNVMSKCIISVNGTPVFTNTPTVYATNDSKCGFAFFTISNDYDGEPVVLNFAPDHSSVLDFVILNGFEIDRTFPPGTLATAIFPLPGDEHIFANNDVPLPGTANAGYTALQWQPAAFAISNYVYFGTNQSAVLNATTASPEFSLASAALNGGTNTMSVTNLNSAFTYYWRVDQLDIDNGVTNLVKGVVWEFRTRHLAFPTAEGYGRFSRGGRGGRVIEVTNLNDSGPGSYRAAVQATGARTVVFRVSGLIRLNGPCVIGNGSLTVAGQTAPGDGICLANWRAGMTSCNDVTMRFMRCRLGDAAQQAMDGIGLGNANNSIIDHTSISWTMDEASSSRQSGRVGSQSAMNTFQHNIISEPLRHSYHYNDSLRQSTGCTDCYQEHAFAASISGEIASYHHNLIAHSTDRNWSLAGGYDQSQHLAGSLDIRNNVVYNWKGRTTDGGVDRLNYVNNYYKTFNASPGAKYLLKTDANDPSVGYGNAGLYYMVGNVMNGVAGQADLFPDNWANGGYNNGTAMQAILQTNAELYPSFIDMQSASNALKVVLSDSGCNLQLQDLIDNRVVGEVMDRTTHYIGTNGMPYIINGVVQGNSDNVPGFIDKPQDVKDYQNTNASLPNYSVNAPWGPYATYNVQLDTDHDGLPDWWEQIKGLNTNSPAGDFSDSNGDPDGDGYSNLEDYLNWLAKPHYDCTNGVTLNVDLMQYTRGFTNATLAATYAVFNPAGGAVSLSGTTAQYTPNTGVDSLGSFYFKVTDNTGFSYTNYVNVHILGDGSVTNAPPAPTGLVATPGNTQVSLAWNNSAGTTVYHVWQSTNSGSGYVNVASTASTSYTIGGLANGTTYYYVVTALNVIGESTNSDEASATPFLPVPAAPTGLSAAAGNGQVSLNWTGISGVTGYYVKRSTTSGASYVVIATNSTPGLIDTGLVNGTTFYYVVSAFNLSGEGANSSQASATPQIPAPTGLAATAGDSSIRLSWTASAGAMNYLVKQATINGGPYTIIVTNATTTYTNTGLVNGLTYYFVVSALGANGESANSSQVSSAPVGAGGAGPLAYEGFNYAPVTNLTASGGTGWGSAWNDKNSLTVVNPSGLGYTDANGNVLVSSGNSITVSNVSSTLTLEPERMVGATTLGTLASTNSNTIWLSYIWQGNNKGGLGTGGNSYRQATLMFLKSMTTTAGSGTEFLDLGMPNINNNAIPRAFSLWDANAIAGGTAVSSTAPIQSSVAANTGTPIFVLVQMTIDNNTTTTDTINVWLNPLLDATVGTLGTPNITFSGQDLSVVNGLRFQSSPVNGTYNVGGQQTVDELRLGGSLSSVTPHTTPSGNTPPVLSAISNQVINVGVTLHLTNSATDFDMPAQTLTYSLSGAPVNATYDTNTGIFNWRPQVSQADTTNLMTVIVADNGIPSLTATQSFSVIVNPLTLPGVSSAILANGQFGLSVDGQAGPDYAVQSSSNLTDWSTLLITNPVVMPFSWSDTNAPVLPMQFYRIKVGPPLP